MLATKSFLTNNPTIPYVEATGPDGAAGTIDGDYKYHIFTATKTSGSDGFNVTDAGSAAGSNTVDYLVIAGGGGGGVGGYGAGAGGAGGYRTSFDSSESSPFGRSSAFTPIR